MSLKKNYYFWMFVLFFLVVLATFLINIGIGSVEIPVKDVVKILTDGLIDGDTNSSIVWKIRLPRAIAVIFGGASIAVSGLIMQIFFRNPIVEPFVLGVSSGATLMVGLVILGGAVLGIPPIFLNSWTTVGAAFFGSLLVMAINLIVASRVKSNVSLLVVGLMIGYVCSALTNMLVTFAEEAQVKGFVVWQMGSFSGFTWNSVKTLVIISIPLLLLSTLMHKPLNAMVLGERYATSLGINIRLVKVFLIGVSSLLSASVTAFAGPVGFIGLAVPHMTRIFMRTSDNKIVFPATMLLGAGLTGICDCIARMLFSPTEIALGSVTSLIGAPLVAYLILRRNKDNG
ncbi:iron ABC transporter permease [Alkalibaculum bacchi]|uniref:iron ABC transporter permease n=1 Tax=Alkalibaculum bacchi TaxID=645887 RepID=UPI0026F0AC2D|nr:iron ABC transporter permease [Alkalibaculum bacchi]